MANSNDVNKLIQTINKKYGYKAVRRGSEIERAIKIPTNVPMWDYIVGGGVAVNKITEIYGPYSSLKTWICQKAIGAFQRYDWANNSPEAITSVQYKTVNLKNKKDEDEEDFFVSEVSKINTRRGYKPEYEVDCKRVALVDFERSYDKDWGKKVANIDNEGLIHVVPQSLNEGIDILEALLMDENISLVVLDSMIALGADREADASMENEQMGVNAAFWNKATRKIQRAMAKNPNGIITLIAINGAYDKMGPAFGDPEVVKNGKNFSLAKSVSIKQVGLKQQTEKIDNIDSVIGRNIKVENKKNKVGTPYLQGTFYVCSKDDGTLKAGESDIAGQLVELGLMFGIIERKGNFYTYGGIKGNGMETFKTALNKEAGIIEQLKELVYEKF